MQEAMVVLASSRKWGGVCLAGKRLGARKPEWVRPVCGHAAGSWTYRTLRARLGDIPVMGERIELPLQRPAPEGHQRENWLVGEGVWRHTGALSESDIIDLLDEELPLWLNGFSSGQGLNDRIPQILATNLCHSSLKLIRPAELRFSLGYAGKLKASFNWAGAAYRLSVTDDSARARWSHLLANGHDGHCDAALTISLGVPYGGDCYKLVAGVTEIS